MTDASAIDNSVFCATLPFPGAGDAPARRRSAVRRRPAGSFATSTATKAAAAPFASWFATRLPDRGPKLDDHAFHFPGIDRDDLVWDWRWSRSDVWTWILARDEDGPVRDPGTAQLLGKFQASEDDSLDPAERLWSLSDFLYRFEPGRRWQALIGDLDTKRRRLDIAWVGSFEGLVWDTRKTLRAIVPTPGSLGDEAMPDPMTLGLEWTGRMALGVGPARDDLEAFRRDDRSLLPLQVHRTTDRA